METLIRQTSSTGAARSAIRSLSRGVAIAGIVVVTGLSGVAVLCHGLAGQQFDTQSLASIRAEISAGLAHLGDVAHRGWYDQTDASGHRSVVVTSENLHGL